MKRLLLVEDEPGLVLTLRDRLTREGYSVDTSADGESGLERAAGEAFDLVLLDVMLPRINGLDVLRELRKRGIETPVIMLTAKGQVADKVVGLKLGADDYVTKPFEMMELLARIEAKLRRAPLAPHPVDGYQFGDVRIDFRRAEVTKAGAPLELSAREFQLLKYFIEHRGATLTREELLNEVWGYNAMPSTRTVDVHVAWLRQKIEPNSRHPQYVLTVHGMGTSSRGESNGGDGASAGIPVRSKHGDSESNGERQTNFSPCSRSPVKTSVLSVFSVPSITRRSPRFPPRPARRRSSTARPTASD